MNKNDTTYKQCSLCLYMKDRDSCLLDTRWIPSEFAKKGKVLKIKNNSGWINGWVVESVGPMTLSHEDILAITRDYTIQRIASDIDGVGELEEK